MKLISVTPINVPTPRADERRLPGGIEADPTGLDDALGVRHHPHYNRGAGELGDVDADLDADVDGAPAGGDLSIIGARGSITVLTSGIRAPKNGHKLYSMRVRTARNRTAAVNAAMKKLRGLRTIKQAIASGLNMHVHAQVVADNRGGFAVRIWIKPALAKVLRDLKRTGKVPTKRTAQGPKGKNNDGFWYDDGSGAPDAAVYDDTGLPVHPDTTPPALPSAPAAADQGWDTEAGPDDGGENDNDGAALPDLTQPSAADALLAQILNDDPPPAEGSPEWGNKAAQRRRAQQRSQRRRRRPPMTAAQRRKRLCERCRRLDCSPDTITAANEANESVSGVRLGRRISAAEAHALEYGHIKSVTRGRSTNGQPIAIVVYDMSPEGAASSGLAGSVFGDVGERVIALPVFGDEIAPVLAQLGDCPCKGWKIPA